LRLSIFTRSALLAVPLALAACDNGDGEGTGGSTTDESTTTTGEPGTTTTTTDESADESTTTGEPPGGACLEEQVIPDPPVDCSGAAGVLDTSAIIEDGGDDPSILDGIVTVNGSIRINRTAETDLNFMACVQEVTGDVTIFGNDQLTNVDGLWNLTSVGTDFIFSENAALTDFDGLPNITGIDRNLIIKNNDSLQTISGFHSLVGIEGNLTIQNNDALLSVDGLGGLQLVNGVLAITANPQLCQSSIICVGEGITVPATPPDTWSTQGNDNGC